MSNIFQPSDMAFLPEEDAATIPPEQAQQLIEQGVLSPAQPGLQTVPQDTGTTGTGTTGTGTTGTGTTGTGTTGTGTGTTGETEAERIARLDREARAEQARLDREAAERADAAARAATEAATGQRRENAFNLITAFLQKAGLAGLDKNIRELLATGIEDSDAILFRLRDTDQFKARFKANAARAAKGLPELDPASYIGLEQAYAATLRANRLPSGFYDQSDDFNALIEGDVSPQELQSRISDGFVKVRDADPEVRRQMQTLYGVGSDEQLAAYFLDPDKGLQALQRQARAAEISARGREQGRLQLTVGQAEELARRGITSEEAQRQFMQRGLLEGLYQPMTGEEALTPEGEIGAIFEYDPVAQRRLAQRREQRVGEFQAGGQFARTSGATSGTIETGVGLAQ